jgi:hypothetical protein
MNIKLIVTLFILVTAVVYIRPQGSFAAPLATGAGIAMLNTAGAAPAAARCANPTTARYGDTVLTIAARCGVSASTIMRLNGLRSSRVWPGQRLYIASVSRTPSIKAVPTPRIEPRIQP